MILTNRLSTYDTQSTISLKSWEREEDGKIKATWSLTGNETFSASFWAQEKEEREKVLDKLCEAFPGVGQDERVAIRNDLLTIARKTRIDLRFNMHGAVNGRAHASIDLRKGNKIRHSESGNILNAVFRNKAIANFATIEAGRKASRQKVQRLTHTIGELFLEQIERARAMPQGPYTPPHPREVVPYSFDEHGINWLTKTREGTDVIRPLTNFTAKILAEVTRDDGSGDPELEFELDVVSGGRRQTLTVKASKFAEMSWPLEKLGTRGLVYAGQGAKDHARAAILWLSNNPTRKHLYTHTGWIQSDKGWMFLHAGGAITADPSQHVDVAMDAAVAKYELPAPAADAIGLRAAARASLNILKIAPADIVYPAYCAVWRSVLGRCNFAVHLVGRSGVFKSELAALLQQHFGSDMHALNLPGAWRSTDNALGELLFLAKDVLCTIDDFKPHGTQQDVQKWHAKADNVFRGQGNGAGKQRMRAEGGLRVTKPPRGMVLSTGEQIPRGESCRARMLIVQVSPGDIAVKDATRPGSEDRLSPCQKEAREGVYAAAMAAFIRWLAQDGRIEKARQDLRTLIPQLRERAQSSTLHRRTPEIVANLYAGLLYWLQFLTESRAITEAEAKQIRDDGWAALGKAAELQLDHQTASEPAARYLELLMSAIASGKAHLAGPNGEDPGEDAAAACGWRKRYGTAWEPSGTRIGWIKGEDVYLEPDAAYRAAQDAAGQSGSAPVDSERELRKRLEEKGLLRVAGDQRFNRKATRKFLEGAQRWVLWLAPGALPLCARAARASEDPNLDFEPPEGGNP